MTYRIPSSSSFTSPSTYTVFLNFRGIDTRSGFTNYLYKALRDKGIETFIDDEELQKGEEITPALVKAIEESRIAIVIFSENYASSPFCLEELVKIIEMMKQNQLMVLPVFYQVEPSDVRHQKGVFGEIFKKLIEKRFKNNTEKVQKWTSSLNAAADLSGWHLEGCDIEYKFVDHIVNEVFKRTTRTPLHVTDHPVGLDSRVQKVMKLLTVNSNEGVNMVGIYGIGGIGKSTIARAVYNKLILDHFDGVCFLDEISKKSKDGLAQLQVKMLGEILGKENIPLKSEDEGITIIKGRLQTNKVLLILDDVNKLEQLQKLAGGLDWFGFGSKIIITTRDKQLLDCHGVIKYEALGLNREEAHELLSRYAFKKGKANPSYTDLLGDAVTYSSGHPLALEVIGANLCGKSRDIWESALRECRGTLNERIHKVLKRSYDGLEKNQQKIFLDLACFFRGSPLGYVTHILQHGRNHLGPKYAIDVLVDKSLIRIDYKNGIIMHDLIQDMGKEIVKDESSHPEKRSRIWSSEDIINVFQRNTGSKNIEVMKVDLPPDQTVEWDGKAFKKMKNLEVLIIKFAYFSTEMFRYLPTSLRLLEWEGCIFEVSFNSFPKNLVAANLSNGNIKLDSTLKEFWSLRFLNLSDNELLTQVPDISKAPNLEKLWLKNCLNLTEVHDHVGKHSKLTELDVTRCSKLSSFPDHIMMKSLEILNLSYCSSLKIFPEISGMMENLKYVNLNYSGIQSLPFSIQNLIGLLSIDLSCKGLSRLPSSILTLPKLYSLSVEGCRSEFSIYCGSEEQEQEQERIGPILERFKDYESEEEEEVEGRHIYFYDCNFTNEFLPTKLQYVSNWKHLSLESCNFMILPPSIKKFSFLKTLGLFDCVQLREIRELPPSLKKLVLDGCKQLQEIRELPPSLENLKLFNCKQLVEIRELPYSLKKLKLIECEQLQGIRELPPNTEEVHVAHCALFTSECLSILLIEKFHEVRGKVIVLPGSRIPEWLDYYNMGPSLSFWCREKFPSIALCTIQSIAGPLFIFLVINGTQNISCRVELCHPLKTDHLVLFDLETHLPGSKVDGLLTESAWNHVEIFGIVFHSKEGSKVINSLGWPHFRTFHKWEFVKGMGSYVYEQENNMENMYFTIPSNHPVNMKFDDFEVQLRPSIKYFVPLLAKLLRREDYGLWDDPYFISKDYLVPSICEMIWNMQALPIIKILLWKILIDRTELPTYKRLFKRKIVDDPLCPICRKDNETIAHVFLECEWASLIWSQAELHWNVDSDYLYGKMKDFLREKTDKNETLPPNYNQTSALVGCICWAIWNEREDFISGGQPVCWKRALDRAHSMHKQCLEQTIFPRPWFTSKIGPEKLFLPATSLPAWIHHRSKGPSLSFWCRKNFPSIALCAIVSSPRRTLFQVQDIVVVINDTEKITLDTGLRGRRLVLLRDHILMFDLEALMNGLNVDTLTIKRGWNHVEISGITCRQDFVTEMGIHVYEEGNIMKDISFIRPNPLPLRTFDDLELQNLRTPLYKNEVVPVTWNAIRNMQAPPAIKILLWEICQRDLPTSQTLFQRKLINSPLCPICEKEDETLQHVFFLCPWTRAIWSGSQFQWVVDFNPWKRIELWIYESFKNNNKVHPKFEQLNTLFGCICWAIWNGRNDFVSEGQPVNPIHALKRAETMCKDHFGPSFVQQTALPQFSQIEKLSEKPMPMRECVQEDHQLALKSLHQRQELNDASRCVELAPTPKRRRLNLKQL